MHISMAAWGREVVVPPLITASLSGRPSSSLIFRSHSRWAAGSAFRASASGMLARALGRRVAGGDRGGGQQDVHAEGTLGELADLADGVAHPLDGVAGPPEHTEATRLRDGHDQLDGAPVFSPIRLGPIPALRIGYSIPSRSHSGVHSVLLATFGPPATLGRAIVHQDRGRGSSCADGAAARIRTRRPGRSTAAKSAAAAGRQNTDHDAVPGVAEGNGCGP